MKFMRRGTRTHLVIGKKRKKRRVWRKPKGRSNKMRENRKGMPPIVSIGYRNERTNKKTVMVYNLKDFENAGKEGIFILGKIGKRKKKEIMKKANEMKIKFQNLNIQRYMKKNELK